MILINMIYGVMIHNKNGTSCMFNEKKKYRITVTNSFSLFCGCSILDGFHPASSFFTTGRIEQVISGNKKGTQNVITCTSIIVYCTIFCYFSELVLCQ